MNQTVNLGFRRRCGWCGVQLRWWQLNLCRLCRPAVIYDHPSSPVRELSRVRANPDGFGRHAKEKELPRG